ncbi:MAG TPA: nucleotidyl transferase AbiEii/AbiGii toxin family protein [Gaiellaceae bacterium]|nr:nucleotidyl transferase AbiEii/AbiGii toxin family protein [Gaiellaceae bacterium]
MQRVVANTVVGQMLPPGVVKGGTAMKVRVGEAASRFTPDFDASRGAQVTLEDYLDQLGDLLAEGWGGFTGTVRARQAREPEGVPAEYVMVPFDLRLAFRDRHWLTVRFELGRDEVGSTEQPDLRLAEDIVEIFAILGLQRPEPLPVMALEHQVAQKLHACTFIDPNTGANERAHDLVDLQILDQEETIDLAAVETIAQRLFASRRAQEWPPVVSAHEGWDTIYAEAAEGLEVIDGVAAAVEWTNDFIVRVTEAPAG